MRFRLPSAPSVASGIQSSKELSPHVTAILMDVFHSGRQFDGSLSFHSVEQGPSTPSRDLGTVIFTPLIEVFWSHSHGRLNRHIRKQSGIVRYFFLLSFILFYFRCFLLLLSDLSFCLSGKLDGWICWLCLMLSLLYIYIFL